MNAKILNYIQLVSQFRDAKGYERLSYTLSEQPLKEKRVQLQKGESTNTQAIHGNMQHDMHSKYQHNDILGILHMK